MVAKKQRTSIVPHKATRYASLFEATMEKIDDKSEGLGWRFKGQVIQPNGNDFILYIEARYNLNGRHAQLFDYAQSRANANKTKKVSFHIKEYLKEAEKGTSWNEQKRAMTILLQLRGFMVGIESEKQKAFYNVVGGVKVETKTGICTIEFSDDMDELFDRAGKRHFNISKTLPLKGGKAYELGKFLQLNGRGIDKRSGEPSYVKSFTWAEAVQYLHLHPKTPKSGAVTINRLLKQLHAVGYPEYTLSQYRWYRVHDMNNLNDKSVSQSDKSVS